MSEEAAGIVPFLAVSWGGLYIQRRGFARRGESVSAEAPRNVSKGGQEENTHKTRRGVRMSMIPL